MRKLSSASPAIVARWLQAAQRTPASVAPVSVTAILAAILGLFFSSSRVAHADDPAFRGEFFVDNYNAAHDGTTDDRAVIEAAINDASTVGGVVKFGAGVYVVSSVGPSGAAFAITSPVIIKGTRCGPGSSSLGTILVWDAPSGLSDPVLMKVGHAAATLEGFGIEDVIIKSEDGHSGHVLWWAGVAYSHMQNLEVRFTTPDSNAKAALFLDTINATAGTTNNWFANCHFVAPTTATKKGYGVLIDCTGSAANTGNEFISCSFSNAGSVTGRDLLIRSTNASGTCDAHHFTNCEFTWQSGAVGVGLSDTNNTQFANCVFDGVAGQVALSLTGQCEGISVFGAVNGSITDDQTDPQLALRLIDVGPVGGRSIQIPYANLVPFSADKPDADSVGTIWLGTLDSNPSAPDSLFIYIDTPSGKARKSIKLVDP
jgi:hypothetical protein